MFLPDLSASTLSSAFSSLASTMKCTKCQAELSDRVRNLVLQWSLVKVRLSVPFCTNARHLPRS
jgi:hypothetical protein